MTFLPLCYRSWSYARRAAWWAVQVTMLPGFVVALPGVVWVAMWVWVQERVEDGR